jgi:4-amino-4-deoxy-L-arabinose transferase
MILVVDGLLKHLEQTRSRIFSGGALITAALTGLAAVFIILSQTINSLETIRIYNNSEALKWIIIVTGLLVFSVFTFFAASRPNANRQITLYCLSPVLLFFSLHFAVPQSFHFKAKECMDPVGMIRNHMDKIGADSVILSESYLIHAVCWVSKRTDIYLFENGGELSYGLSYNDSKRRCIQPEQLNYLTRRAKRTVTLITDTSDYERYGDRLPKPFYIENTNGFVFAQYRYEKKEQK